MSSESERSWLHCADVVRGRALDLGCGEGKLLQALLADRQFERIVGGRRLGAIAAAGGFAD